MSRQRILDGSAVAALVIAVVVAGLAKAQAAPSPAAKVFAALDANHDQVVSAQEFEAGYAGLQRAVALGLRLREQFTTMDSDRSGALEAGEFANLLLVKQAGKAAPSLAAFDADRNGRLDFAEYLVLVQKLAATTPAAGTP